MPTYEYKCKDCGFKFEEFQSIVAAPLEKCPSCQGKLERLLSGGAGLIFKGSGFYITDYKQNKAKGNSDSTSKPKESENKSKSDTEKSSS
jgi:putative FmdB family regulatory protein